MSSGTFPYLGLLDATVAEGGELPELRGLIGGRGAPGEAVEGATEARVSPATGERLFTAAPMSREQVAEAVRRGRELLADEGWRSATGQQRQRWLLGVAQALEAHASELARLIVYETGKPISEAEGEVGAAVNSFEYFGALARDVNGTAVTRGPIDRWGLKLPEPAGVAGLVTPWNFPLAVLCQKLPAALAAGCPSVVKPSPLTPMTVLALGELIIGSGMPAASVQVVLGDREVGDELVAHPDVGVVSFTGSSATGRAVAQAAQRHRLKPVAIEGTGNAALVVAPDADPREAAAGALTGGFFMQGECCVGTSRLIVHEDLADDFRAALVEGLDGLRVGDPLDSATRMGALASPEHGQHLESLVAAATSAGARVTAGQDAPRWDDALPGGPYWAPTVIEQVATDSELLREETFGPIVTIQRYESLDEAIRLANDTPYGLGASVWTHDMRAARRLIERIEAGLVWVNGTVDSYPELPLSGRKDSGLGIEFGREGMEFFLSNKTVHYVNT